jgi:DNA polymerase III subunit epsilon
MPNIDFVSLDVETANATQDSICQIGLVVFQDGQFTARYDELINPQEDFEKLNTSIHGITPQMVSGQPLFPDIYPALQNVIHHQLVIHYGSFDYHAVKKACMKYKLPAIPSDWLDLSKLVRAELGSHDSLATTAAALGIQYTPHNAVSDAEAAAQVFQWLLSRTAHSLVSWLSPYVQPFDISPAEAAAFVNTAKVRFSAPVAKSGCGDGPLVGQVIVFTGNLSISRPEAADLAAKAGADVSDSFTKRTTILVVGDRDVEYLHISEKSGKHRKAEEAIAKGQNLCIITETEFLQRIDLS